METTYKKVSFTVVGTSALAEPTRTLSYQKLALTEFEKIVTEMKVKYWVFASVNQPDDHCIYTRLIFEKFMIGYAPSNVTFYNGRGDDYISFRNVKSIYYKTDEVPGKRSGSHWFTFNTLKGSYIMLASFY